MSDLLYLQEHISCGHYVSDYRCSFTHRVVGGGVVIKFDPRHNYLLFLLDGEALVDCDEFTSRRLAKGNISFIAKSSEAHFTAVADSQLVVCVFDSVDGACDKFDLTSCWPICQKIRYNFDPVPIIPQFEAFFETLVYYIEQGVMCEHFHKLKQQEMFLIFRWFYSKETLAALFFPIIGPSLDFRTFVLENYRKVGGVSELARMAAMSRSGFDIAFKKEFGIPVGQWMLQQKAKRIKFDMLTPEITLNDIMFKYDFNSSTHFTRFCKQQFGCTPSEMMIRMKEERNTKRGIAG